MLLEFSCSNHKSIKQKIIFSALAGSDTSNEDQVFTYRNYRVLKNAVIYGANGSGKSNFVNAIYFMKSLVINSIKHQPGQLIFQVPHKLLGINNDSEYTMQFVKNNIRYAYGFILNNTYVKEEYLYSFPNDRQQKIFERKNEVILSGNKYKGKFELCKEALMPNRLLLSCAANFSSIDEIKLVYSFFKDDLIIYSRALFNDWLNYSLGEMYNNQESKKLVLSILDSLDTGIKDIAIRKEIIQYEDNNYSQYIQYINEETKNLLNQKHYVYKASVIYDSFEIDLIKDESQGIKKLVEFLCPFINIIKNGKVFICDEIETNLHESILCALLNIFKHVKGTDNVHSQMFFTTHDTSILNLSLFRRDQVWFTELSKKDRSTDLYSLSEIKNVRKEENIEKGYISGRYGAIPMLNETIKTFLNEE